MLKWIASGCLVVILVVCVVAYAGYRKMQSIAADGPSVTVGIRATPERVFATMTHTDSLPHWFASGYTLRSSRTGKLAAGDTLRLIARRDSLARTAWVIDSIVPNQLIVLHWALLENGVVLHRRRDSLSVSGDSTLITSTVAAAMTDSLAAAGSKAGGATGGMLGMASTMGTASARLMAEQELLRLKLRIEGPPVSPP